MLRISARQIPSLDLPVVKYDSFEDLYQVSFAQNTLKLFKSKSLLLGIPGAFFPSSQHKLVPEYIKYFNELKALCEVSRIFLLSVNDPYVLQTFAEEIDAEDKVTYVSDFKAELTNHFKVGNELKGAGLRSKAFRCIVEAGTITHWACEEDWKVTSATRVYSFLREVSPYLPYPNTVYDN